MVAIIVTVVAMIVDIAMLIAELLPKAGQKKSPDGAGNATCVIKLFYSFFD